MELRLGTRERGRPTIQEVPTLRAADLRRSASPLVGRGESSLHVLVEAPCGQQEIVLVRDPRPFGPRYLAQCSCGRRTLFLRLAPESISWRCAKCQKLRSARDRYGETLAFVRVMRPLLDLDRLRRRMAHKYAPRVRKDGFAEIEKRVLIEVAGALTEMSRSRPARHQRSAEERRGCAPAPGRT